VGIPFTKAPHDAEPVAWKGAFVKSEVGLPLTAPPTGSPMIGSVAKNSPADMRPMRRSIRPSENCCRR